MDYDLKSLKLPKLYGKMLSIFASLVSSPITRPFLIGSLLENGGIPKLRKIRFDEEPTYYPLVIPTEHASGPADLPQDPTTNQRSTQDHVPYKLVRDYALAYRAGSISPLEVAEQVILAIQKSDQTSPALRAFVASDPADIRKQAEASAERLKQGKPLSLIDGVPIAIKDEVDMLPYPTTVGTKFLGLNPVLKDSFVVERLRAAGALLVGKTNMHEIGISANGENPHHGRIANPYDLQRDSGGSSSGSGAAVAAGIVPAAVGADGGGSIRVPASLCGVVGLKPTFGRVSEAGAAPLCWSVAHLGPLGASVEDVALIYQIIAGPDPHETLTHQQPPVTLEGWNTPDLKGIRVGVYPEWLRHASPKIVSLNEKMIADFEAVGAEVVNVVVPQLDAMRIAHAMTILCEMAASMRNYQEHWNDFAPNTRLSLVLGQSMSSHDYLQAQRMRTRAMKIFADVFKDVDVILTPGTALTAPIVPPKAESHGWSDLGTDTEMMRFVYASNFTGNPAITFPVGYDSNGLPVGMQAIGRHWEENLLLRIAFNAELKLKRIKPLVYLGPT